MSQVDTTITHITEANSNIFEELGFDKVEAEKLKIKAQLMCQISEWIKERELKQEEASKLFSTLSKEEQPYCEWVNTRFEL